MENFKESIDKKLESLPEDIREAISSTDVPRKIQSIMQKYSIHLDAALDIETEVSLVMLGLQNPADFIRNLRENAGLSPEDARNVATDINDTIFKPIRNSLVGIQPKPEEGKLTPKPETENKLPPPPGFKGPYTKPEPHIKEESSTSPKLDVPSTKDTGNAIPTLESEKKDTAPLPTEPRQSIVEQKLNTLVSLPKEETNKSTPVLGTDGQKPGKRGYVADPYREPTK